MENEAIALTPFVTARRVSGQILLFVPSDKTEAGGHVAAQEIYLKKDAILRLAEWAAKEE